jgi:predicted DNA-binding transcriptional regulator AlpA
MKKIEEDLNPELMLTLNAFMNEKAVMQATTLSRTSLHRKRLAGKFPEPEVISPGRVGYRVRDIFEWLQDPQAWTRH